MFEFEINGALVVSVCISLLLIISHILFYLKNNLSVDNTTITSITTMTSATTTRPLKIVVFDMFFENY